MCNGDGLEPAIAYSNAVGTVSGQQKPGQAQQYATRVVFFLGGFSLACWAPLVPYAQNSTRTSPAELGTILLCLGLGSILAIPLSGALAGRIGCRQMILFAGTLICLSLPLLATTHSHVLLALGLLIFGAAIGCFDVVVNIHALIVQEAAGRQMLPGFHALWSIGEFMGSGLLAFFLSMGLAPLPSVSVIICFVLAALFLFGRHLLDYGSNVPASTAFVAPRGVVFFIGALCFVLYLAEESMLDWTGLFLTDVRKIAPAQAGLGYTMWSGAMTLGRFAGDRVVDKFGSKLVVTVGGFVAVIGLVEAISINSQIFSLIGFGLVGLGMSNLLPILYTTVGTQSAMPVNMGLAAVATMGYTGTLLGPIIIGNIANVAGLSFGLLTVAGALLILTITANRVV